MDFRHRLASLGRLIFAAGIAAFGIQHFIFGDFIPGRAPTWPAEVSGRLPWAWSTGAFFILAGFALLTGKAVRPAALIAAAFVFSWALTRHIPLVASDVFLGGAWTAAGKALVVIGGLAAVAGTYSAPERRELLLLAGRVSLGGFMMLCGFQHYKWDAFVITLVPTWVPGGGAFWTYTSGVLLIAGGLGLMLPRTTRLAAGLSGLMIFLWVFLLHIPRALAATNGNSRNEWTSVVEAFAFSGLAFLLSARRAAQRSPATPAGAPASTSTPAPKHTWDHA